MTGHRPFRFGIINERMTTRQRWQEQARRAEALGYATFLIRDHFVPDYFGDQFAPFAALMSAADATTTLRVGNLVIDNDYRHPVVLAKEVATLDVLSDGRFELGLGAGWLRGEYDQAGIPFDPPGVRVSRMEESIQVLKGLFADGPLTFTGAHYAIAGLDGFPKPVQRPHPPLLVGGGGKRMLGIAGREADIVHLLSRPIANGMLVAEPGDYRTSSVVEKLNHLREAAGDRFAGIELSLMPIVVITDDRRAATERLILEQGWGGVPVEAVWDMPAFFIGSVDQIVAEMRERRESLGFSYLIVTDDQMKECSPIVARLVGT